MREDDRGTLLILGLGNVLCGDDGLGVRVVESIHRHWVAPPGARVLDGGTLGLSLLAQFRETDRVILVDAIEAGGGAQPGTLVRFVGEAVEPAVRQRLSVHQVGVADLLDALRLLGEFPDQLVLLGMVPSSLALTVDLTPPVAAGLEELAERVIAEARRLGFRFRPKVRYENPTVGARGAPRGVPRRM